MSALFGSYQLQFCHIHCHYAWGACAESSLPHGLFSSCSKGELLSACGTQASHCGGFSCCGAQAFGHTSFRSWRLLGSRALDQLLWHTGLATL